MASLGRRPGAAPITSADIPDNSITAAKIVDATIAAGDLASDVVISTSGAITTTGALAGATLTTTGNVGIGTAAPDKQLEIAHATDPVMRFTRADSGIVDTENLGSIQFSGDDPDGSTGAIIQARAEGTWATNDLPSALLFYTCPGGSGDVAERMRIDSSGNVLIGTSGIEAATFKGLQCGVSVNGANYLSHNPSGTGTYKWSFGMNPSNQFVVYGFDGTSFNSGAYIAWSATSWTASSDERKKDIIEPITDATTKVNTLRAVIGKYKTDEEDKRRSFLIAQDVQAVLPEAVEMSNPDDLGIQYTEVIPLLVASIKELSAKVTALESA